MTDQAEQEAERNKIHLKMLEKSDTAKKFGELTVIPIGFAVSIAQDAERWKKEVMAPIDQVAALLQAEILKARIDGRIEVLREVVDNPGRKTYFYELLNNALKERRQLQTTKQNKETE